MTDFTATRPFNYVALTTIDPDQNNPNENAIYIKHNAAFHATTGHFHTGGTGDGPKLGASSLDLTANYAWTGSHSWSLSSTVTNIISANTASIKVANTATTVNNYQSLDFINNTGALVGRIASVNEVHTAASEATHLSFVNMVAGTLTEQFRVSNVGAEILAGKKLVLNGIGGDAYWSVASPNVISGFVGGNERFNIQAAEVGIVGCNLTLGSTHHLSLDGGGNSWLSEGAPDQWTFHLNGGDRLTLDASSATTNFMTFTNTNQTTGNIINIPNADSLTTGSVINIVSNSASGATRSLVNVQNSTGSNSSCMKLTQNADDKGLYVELNSGGSSSRGIFIDNNTSSGMPLETSDSGANVVGCLFSKSCNSASTTSTITVLGTNSGAGIAVGIDLNDASLDAAFSINGTAGGTGTGAYGTFIVNIPGIGLKRVRLYDLT